MSRKATNRVEVVSHAGLFAALAVGALLQTTMAVAAKRCEDVIAVREWYRKENHRVNERLHESPNRKAVEQWLEGKFGEATTLRKFNLKSGGKLKLVRNGFKGSTDLVLEKDETSEVLFSNFSLRRNHSIGIKDVVLSADQKRAALVLYEKGSIDQFQLVIFDVAEKKVILKDQAIRRDKVAWDNNDSILFTTREDDGARVTRLNISTGKTERAGKNLNSGARDWCSYWPNSSKTRIFDQQGNSVIIASESVNKIGGRLGNVLIFTNYEGNGGTIRSVPLDGNSNARAKNLFKKETRVVDDLELTADGAAMVATTHWGAKQFMTLIRDEGARLEEISLPTCCSFAGAELLQGGKKLKVSLKSTVSKKQDFVYDLEKQKWEDSALVSKMLTLDGVEMVSEVVEVESSDGEKIPMLVTRRKDLQPNGNNPVLMRVYGGFNKPGNLAPGWDPLHADFLLRGGILAGPGVRGGNEFGSKWWSDAKNTNKSRTINDVVASADWFTANQWSRGELIITRGASNGGFVVSSAALQSPRSFGLVLPTVGVYDTGGIGELDKPFASYWQKEYGDPAKSAEKEAQEKVSPYVQATQVREIPRMVLISAVNDSRVNYLHSVRLGRALAQNPHENVRTKFEVVTLKNAGHFLYSMPYQDLIAFRTNSVIWSTIFDHIGWTFTPPKVEQEPKP